MVPGSSPGGLFIPLLVNVGEKEGRDKRHKDKGD